MLSGPLPMGLNRAPQAVPGMLLVGDAAGAVNPFNGEGIAYAMETGEMAAELVHEALVQRPARARAMLYPTALRERYGRVLHDRPRVRAARSASRRSWAPPRGYCSPTSG